MFGFGNCCWYKLAPGLFGIICDMSCTRLLLPPSFHVAILAGRKLGLWTFAMGSGWDLRSGVVAKRGKSFNGNKLGICSFGFVPDVIVLHVGAIRGLSMSINGCACNCGGCWEGGGVSELTGNESICCCVGLGVIIIDDWFSFDVQLWFVVTVGSNVGELTPVSLFKLGKFAGGGIRRLLIFPKFAHPWGRPMKKKKVNWNMFIRI